MQIMNCALNITCGNLVCLISTNVVDTDVLIETIREAAAVGGYRATVRVGEDITRVVLDKDRISEDEFVNLMEYLCRITDQELPKANETTDHIYTVYLRDMIVRGIVGSDIEKTRMQLDNEFMVNFPVLCRMTSAQNVSSDITPDGVRITASGDAVDSIPFCVFSVFAHVLYNRPHAVVIKHLPSTNNESLKVAEPCV